MFKTIHTKKLVLLSAAALVMCTVSALSYFNAADKRNKAKRKEKTVLRLQARADKILHNETAVSTETFKTENFLAHIEQAVNASKLEGRVLSIRNIEGGREDTGRTLEITLLLHSIDELMPLLENLSPVPAQKLDISRNDSGRINIRLQISQAASSI